MNEQITCFFEQITHSLTKKRAIGSKNLNKIVFLRTFLVNYFKKTSYSLNPSFLKIDVSESLRSLMTKERLWANRSGQSPKKKQLWAICSSHSPKMSKLLVFLSESLIFLQKIPIHSEKGWGNSQPWPNMNRQKRFHKLFRFCKDIRSLSLKIVCPRVMLTSCQHSQRLGGHTFLLIFVNIFVCVIVINDYANTSVSVVSYYKDFADTVSAWSMTALKLCQHSQWLCRHVSV